MDSFISSKVSWMLDGEQLAGRIGKNESRGPAGTTLQGFGVELMLLLTRVMRMAVKEVDGCAVGRLGGRADGRTDGRWVDA